MPDIAPIAIQTTSEPTNKLAAGAQYAAGAGAVIATAIVTFGEPALRELLANGPAIVQGPGVSSFIIGAVILVATYFGGQKAGLSAGYNVMDKPNVPLQVGQSPTISAG